MNRIPHDAFEQYVAMGSEGSYSRLADAFGVSKRAVQKRADRDCWTERLEKIERRARERSDLKLGETLEEMRTRHLQMLKAMGNRVVTALRDYPLTSGMEAMKAAETVIKLERLIAGDPSERTELTVEEVTKRELDQLVVQYGDGGSGENGLEKESEGDEDDW